MAYFNGFPTTYQPVVPQYPVMQTQQQGNAPIWIQGEAAAKSYLTAPGSTVVLFDSEQKTIYIKSADAAGMPSMKILDYTIRGEEEKPQTEYATKDEVNALAEKIKGLKDELKKKARLLKEDEDDE